MRAQPRPHVALSPKGILLSLPNHTQITREKHTHKQRIQRKEKERKHLISQRTGEEEEEENPPKEAEKKIPTSASRSYQSSP